MGRPSDENPQGTEIPGIPARFAESVKMSDKYMVRGSSVIAPNLKAGVGATGARITSQVSKALLKSLTINVLTWDALP